MRHIFSVATNLLWISVTLPYKFQIHMQLHTHTLTHIHIKRHMYSGDFGVQVKYLGWIFKAILHFLLNASIQYNRYFRYLCSLKEKQACTVQFFQSFPVSLVLVLAGKEKSISDMSQEKNVFYCILNYYFHPPCYVIPLGSITDCQKLNVFFFEIYSYLCRATCI